MHRFFSSLLRGSSFGQACLYFWEPFALGRPFSHPAYSYLAKGDVGHISLAFKKYDGKSVYFSAWPKEDPSDLNPQGDPIKKARVSTGLQEDIDEEGGRYPAKKSIHINEMEYNLLNTFVDEYIKKTQDGGSPDGGKIWGIKSNCADDVYDALRSADLAPLLPNNILPRTPKEIFDAGFRGRNLLQNDIKYSGYQK